MTKIKFALAVAILFSMQACKEGFRQSTSQTTQSSSGYKVTGEVTADEMCMSNVNITSTASANVTVRLVDTAGTVLQERLIPSSKTTRGTYEFDASPGQYSVHAFTNGCFAKKDISVSKAMQNEILSLTQVPNLRPKSSVTLTVETPAECGSPVQVSLGNADHVIPQAWLPNGTIDLELTSTRTLFEARTTNCFQQKIEDLPVWSPFNIKTSLASKPGTGTPVRFPCSWNTWGCIFAGSPGKGDAVVFGRVYTDGPADQRFHLHLRESNADIMAAVPSRRGAGWSGNSKIFSNPTQPQFHYVARFNLDLTSAVGACGTTSQVMSMAAARMQAQGFSVDQAKDFSDYWNARLPSTNLCLYDMVSMEPTSLYEANGAQILKYWMAVVPLSYFSSYEKLPADQKKMVAKLVKPKNTKLLAELPPKGNRKLASSALTFKEVGMILLINPTSR